MGPWKCFQTQVQRSMAQKRFVTPCQLNNAVIPNRGAATHKGAVRRCQRCRQMFIFLPFLVFYKLRSYKQSIFVKGCREAKKVENHWSNGSISVIVFLRSFITDKSFVILSLFNKNVILIYFKGFDCVPGTSSVIRTRQST